LAEAETPRPYRILHAVFARQRWPPFSQTVAARAPASAGAQGARLITGVADDDPWGIAIYPKAGARFGFARLWTMPVAFPLMAAVQTACATIVRVIGKGLAANIRSQFPPGVLYLTVALLVIANTINIAALISAFDRPWMAALFVAVSILLQVFLPYLRDVNFLKWLTLSLLAYAGVLLTV